MSKITQLPVDVVIRARMFAIKIAGQNRAKRLRETRWECGRLQEELLVANYPRWLALKHHDELWQLITARLDQIDKMKGRPAAPVATFERRKTA